MASYFLTIPASDACIEFIRRRPDSLYDFVSGNPPEGAPAKASLWQRLTGRAGKSAGSLSVPSDWPTEEAELNVEINHRNVDLYHWMLNGTPQHVQGVGSIFQTWLSAQHAAIDLDGSNASFAFTSGQLAELAKLFACVSREMARECHSQWLREEGRAELEDEEADAVWADFTTVAAQVADCAATRRGLIWTSA